jgi:glycosyltransferase involved in cell wall biosynthesis
MTNKKKYFPFVSVCTPTFNRRPFIENMIRCYKNQTYPKNRMEWIIIDDGTDKIQDLLAGAKITNLKYFAVEKMNLGAKRNFMHTKTKGSFIVYMDDDDYYPPERVEHAVDMLQQNPKALCAGSSEIYIYFKSLTRMVQCGPYGPNHSTAGTFAFKKELLDITRYDDDAALAEERAFLKEYTIPFVQLDPLKTILVFSHEHNTFDKREMLKNPHPDYMKDSDKTVDTFIRESRENEIKKFFMEDIDDLLEAYEPGLPKNKPEVLKQTIEIKKKRAELEKQNIEALNKQPTGIVMDITGQGRKDLTRADVVKIIQTLQAQNADLIEKFNKKPALVVTQNGEQKELMQQDVVNMITSFQKQNGELVQQANVMKSQLQMLSDMKDTVEKKYTALCAENESLKIVHDTLKTENDEYKQSDDRVSSEKYYKMELETNTLLIKNKEMELEIMKLQTSSKVEEPISTPTTRVVIDSES